MAENAISNFSQRTKLPLATLGWVKQIVTTERRTRFFFTLPLLWSLRCPSMPTAGPKMWTGAQVVVGFLYYSVIYDPLFVNVHVKF